MGNLGEVAFHCLIEGHVSFSISYLEIPLCFRLSNLSTHSTTAARDKTQATFGSTAGRGVCKHRVGRGGFHLPRDIPVVSPIFLVIKLQEG